MIATAALATAAGFLVLLLSPIPMVRGFGLLLVAGSRSPSSLALTAGLAPLSLTPARGERRRRAVAVAGGARGGPRARRGRGARAARGSRRVGPPGARGLDRGARAGAARSRSSSRSPAGSAGTRTEVISDIRELVPARPARAPGRRRARGGDRRLRRASTSTVDAPTTSPIPAVIAWMADFKQRVLDRARLRGRRARAAPARTPSSARASRSPTSSASQAAVAASADRAAPRRCCPTYFSQAVVDRDAERATAATALIAFGIRVMPLRRAEGADRRHPRRDRPAGHRERPARRASSAEVVGLPVLAADANSALSGNRYLLTVAGLLAVALVAARASTARPRGRSCR